MSIVAQKPYLGYKLYKREERYYAVLVKSNTERTTVAYAKYLAEVQEGKRLGKSIHAHHKDGDKKHDVISNIKICSHAIHGLQHRVKERWMSKGICCVCGTKIYKPYRGCLPRRCKKYMCCSRKCGYKKQELGIVLKLSRGVVVYAPVAATGT